MIVETRSQEKLDRIDIKILTMLQADGRVTNQTLADAVGLSPSPCLQRVRRLERAGVITGYRAHIDLKKVCRHVDVVATIVLRSHGIEDFAGFEEVVGGMPYIVECTKVSGSIDYIVRFACPDLDSYHMLSDQLLKLGPRIAQLSSHVVLSAVKPYQGIALDGLL